MAPWANMLELNWLLGYKAFVEQLNSSKLSCCGSMGKSGLAELTSGLQDLC